MEGVRLYAAVPDVQTIIMGDLVDWAMPRAIKPALLSSLNVLVVMYGCLVKASVKGAQREPGQSTTCFMFLRTQSSAIS